MSVLECLHGNVLLVDVFYLVDLPIFNKFDCLKIRTKKLLLTVESAAVPNLSERRFFAASSTASYKIKE
jgi:hypothetical protein